MSQVQASFVQKLKTFKNSSQRTHSEPLRAGWKIHQMPSQLAIPATAPEIVHGYRLLVLFKWCSFQIRTLCRKISGFLAPFKEQKDLAALGWHRCVAIIHLGAKPQLPLWKEQTSCISPLSPPLPTVLACCFSSSCDWFLSTVFWSQVGRYRSRGLPAVQKLGIFWKGRKDAQNEEEKRSHCRWGADSLGHVLCPAEKMKTQSQAL